LGRSRPIGRGDAIARTSPVMPQLAARRWPSGMANRAERQSRMVEETAPTNKHSPSVDEVAEFVDECVWSADGRPGRCPISSSMACANRCTSMTVYRLAV